MLLESIIKSFEDAPKRKWDTLYYYFDIHATIFEPDYDNSSATYYPMAKETLQLLTNWNPPAGLPKIVLGLYTCSHPAEVERYQETFRTDGILFKYVNLNPEVPDTALGCYSQKPYYNVLFEDKAAFRPHEWKGIFEWLTDKMKQ